MAQLIDLVVHIRYNGRSEELPLMALELDSHANDWEIKQAVAGYYGLPPSHFDEHVVVRHNRAIVLRPEAIYG